MIGKPRPLRGVTLIETQIASAVFVVGITALLASFATFAVTLREGENMTHAMAIADALLEDFAVDAREDARLSTIEDGFGTDDPLLEGAGGYQADVFGHEDASGPFAVRFTVVPGRHETLRLVVVRVSWQGRVRSHHIELATHVFR